MSQPAHALLGTGAPAGNRILAGLPRRDLLYLEPIEHVRLPARYALLEAGKTPSHLYFPAGGVISFVHVTESGAMPEIAYVGAEGVIGVGALLGAGSARHRAVVQVAGDGYRVSVSSARKAFALSRDFQALTLKFAEALMLQLSQHVVCKLSHTVEQRLCQRLLLWSDQTGGAPLEMTHEHIAEALGSRRQGITEAARKLQMRQVIAYARGRISVLDRAALERHACECYRVLRDAGADVS